MPTKVAEMTADELEQLIGHIVEKKLHEWEAQEHHTTGSDADELAQPNPTLPPQVKVDSVWESIPVVLSVRFLNGPSLKHPRFGSAAGLFELADDFDAPLEDFAEYTA